MAGGALSVGVLAGCPNSYTCADYGTCAYDAGPDTGADAKTAIDAPQKHHDAGVDATTDGRTSEAGKPDVTGSDARTTDAARDVAVDTHTCDGNEPPSAEPCVISEAYGVFVAPPANGGSDTNGDGARTKPFATVSKGIASAAGKRVYVCAASYAEQLAVTSPVSVYGGLACPTGAAGDWGYTGTLASVGPSVPGYALDVESVTSAHFEDMAFTSLDANAADAGAPGASSIAVMVNASTGVSFTRVSATAGAGMKGASGSAWSTSNWCADGGMVGTAAPDSGLPGSPGTCTCAVVTSDKSKGGFGGAEGAGGGPGTATPDASAGGGTGAGGALQAGSSCPTGGGYNGANGAALDGGSTGPAGSLTGSGWVVQTAGSGATGDPGQGGGGGGGTSNIGGAGGGAGGCGGTGAAGAMGGGASIAIAVVRSWVSYSSVKLTTRTGGSGGSGGAGQPGQGGGLGGFDQAAGECAGGNGGAGAGGGGGGGGAGGPSVGVAWTGDASIWIDDAGVRDATTLALPSAFNGGGGGPGGGGGAGGAPGSGNGITGVVGLTGRDGPTGSANAVAGF